MDASNRPGVIRLLIYMLVAAGVSGGFAGWVQSSEAALWTANLNTPDWTPVGILPNLISILTMQLIAISLWITQRSERGAFRFLAAALTLGIVAGLALQVCITFGGRDVQSGFLAALALWLYALFTVAIVGRCSRPAGWLLWPLFAWLTFVVALSFEVMRLNNTSTFVGGL
ncbi:tryptophan-rich sensory protein [Maricaulis salignorans]|uniref:TspO and MBR related proteins n=1 Tax=Maricaulis salignorans TaxID=144026 RepID=A0A1G9LIJ1_9PROT|nr:tryptophan-rich sensory protein [Maricaulis salignorans]SDL61697.1 TspO and MBR related proteins [Maricaulis salignorans]